MLQRCQNGNRLFAVFNLKFFIHHFSHAHCVSLKKFRSILKALWKKPWLEVKVHLILLNIYLYLFCSFLKRTKSSLIKVLLLQSLAEVRTIHFPILLPSSFREQPMSHLGLFPPQPPSLQAWVPPIPSPH